jgi:hypothetical protein
MTAHIWGAHAPRVLAMTPSSSRTFSPGRRKLSVVWQEDCFGEGAETSTRGAWAPRNGAAASSHVTK